MRTQTFKGNTNFSIEVRAYDPAADWAPLDLANVTGLTAYYSRGETGDPVSITLSNLSDLQDAHADGGFLKKGTGAVGKHRLDLPDAAIATGVNVVYICPAKAAVWFEPIAIDLTTDDPYAGVGTAQTGDSFARLGAPLGASVSADMLTLLGADTTYKKNVAVTAFGFYMENTDGTPGTGKTVTAKISKDGGALTTITPGTVAEISQGLYKINIAQGEMNADELLFTATATGCKQTTIKIRTQA